jgi:hypothetical protein
MKKWNLTILIILLVLMSSCKLLPDAISGATKGYDADGNSYYHRTDETKLKTNDLFVEGEVGKAGKVNLRKYYKREVFHKLATLSDSGKVNFVGAYRYRGYSLFDLLNPYKVEKKNAEQFKPTTDVYIIVENDAGDKVVFSWAEIYLTHTPHQIIIATEQASIEPYKREVNYPKSTNWKLVAANDLFAYREIENPTRITVKSFDKKEYMINRELDDPYSPSVNIYGDSELKLVVDAKTIDGMTRVKYNSVFYGMGMGYHNTTTFEGVMLRPLVNDFITLTSSDWFRNGLACVVGKDGFRNVYSVSELLNRVDQTEPILAIPPDNSKCGMLRLYHPNMFYADFSVKNLAEMYFFKE